jgi:hypothetical protein
VTELSVKCQVCRTVVPEGVPYDGAALANANIGRDLVRVLYVLRDVCVVSVEVLVLKVGFPSLRTTHVVV